MARSQIIVAPLSTAALIISTTTPDGPTALLNFILEMNFFTLRMVIGIYGPSSGGSTDRCSGSQFHIEKSLIVFKSCLAKWILVILKVGP